MLGCSVETSRLHDHLAKKHGIRVERWTSLRNELQAIAKAAHRTTEDDEMHWGNTLLVEPLSLGDPLPHKCVVFNAMEAHHWAQS